MSTKLSIQWTSSGSVSRLTRCGRGAVRYGAMFGPPCAPRRLHGRRSALAIRRSLQWRTRRGSREGCAGSELRHVGELRVAVEEGELARAGRAGPMLGHDDLGDALVGRLLVIE